MRQVIIMQGVSGSGKSTLARRLAEVYRSQGAGTLIVSADDYFVKLGGGTYKHDASKLGEAHNECFRTFMAFIQGQAVGAIIVDNTNHVVADIAPYMRAADAYGWDAKIVRVACDPNVAVTRNTHNVPPALIAQQEINIRREHYPHWWTIETVAANETTEES